MIAQGHSVLLILFYFFNRDLVVYAHWLGNFSRRLTSLKSLEFSAVVFLSLARKDLASSSR